MKNTLSLSLIATVVSCSVYADTQALDALTDIKVSGQWRTMYMEENNKADQQDWHGLATGGKLKLETGKFNNFNFGIAGYLSQDVASNKNEIDPDNKNKPSRYVLGMFDVTDPDDNTIALLGEAYVKWSQAGNTATLGRMKINTPMMNAFDGRMIPNLFQGAWGKYKLSEKLALQAGVITHMATRGTEKFDAMEDVVGVLSQGKTPSGSNSDYAGNIDSSYVGVLSANYQASKNTKLQFWDYYWENVFNSAYLQADYSRKVNELTFATSAQYIHQNIVGNGGNSDESKSYVEDDFKSNTYGAKFEIKGYGASFSVAATKITDDGRFTKPREWGKDPLFTFQKRELGDGYGDSDAWLVRAKYNFAKLGIKGLKLVVDYGQHSRNKLEGEDKFTYNKYAFPSFNQLNIDVIYNSNHLLKGSTFELLYVTKHDRDNTNNQAFEQNKAEMEQLSAIFNLSF